MGEQAKELRGVGIRLSGLEPSENLLGQSKIGNAGHFVKQGIQGVAERG